MIIIKADPNYLRPVISNLGFVKLKICYLKGFLFYFSIVIERNISRTKGKI